MDLFSILAGLALVLGAFMLFAGVMGILLTVVGVASALIFLKTRQIIVPRVTLFILNILEAPVRYMLWMFGIEEDVVSNLVIEVRNLLYTRSYNKTPYKDRAIFLPQCLRNPKCPAPLTPEGIKCMGCGRCGIGAIKDEAERLGTRVFIAPGSSLIKRMVKKYRPKAILGVGCHMEVNEGTAKMASYGLPVQGVVLDRDGCVDTRVNVLELLERIKSHSAYGRYHIEEDLEFQEKAVEISKLWGAGSATEVEIIEAVKKSEKGKW
ncbi:MAG: DUF116 domain-containing protein [Candidatus Altiarchaeales archaeon]|nr:DUF116 domain-containing protein [Candidatus Altiarchaeales archaeon]MBD3416759.1 DUF116 domain-containing protein [Candidatus Altiarchaeales archaeon]